MEENRAHQKVFICFLESSHYSGEMNMNVNDNAFGWRHASYPPIRIADFGDMSCLMILGHSYNCLST
jgi:hypothetical protein